MLSAHSDTIAAIATPTGLGGISIIRISGNQSLAILHKLFVSPVPSFTFKPRTMHFGHIYSCPEQHTTQPPHAAIPFTPNPAEQPVLIDEVLAVYMPAPQSATGQDVAEIHCHGGIGVTTCILEAVLAAGARLAEAGEFTRRAFLHGKIDLTQAEAVAEIIHAPTKQGVRLATAKMSGVLGKTIAQIRHNLDALRMQVTLAVDFPEEDAELLPRDAFITTLAEATASIQSLLAAFERAQLWREGATATLVGSVNAGKSSLFNALLGRHRAIVSPIAGTTRDYIEETINMQGLPLRLVDTAGLRTSNDIIEQEGITLSYDLAHNTDALLIVIDSTKPQLEPAEVDFLHTIHQHVSQDHTLVVFNKVDNLAEGAAPAPALRAAFTGYTTLAVSAATGEGMEQLANAVRAVILKEQNSTHALSDVSWDIAPNLRQSQHLKTALHELAMLTSATAADMPADILGVHLEYAVQALDAVTGTTDNEALLDQIFSTFCIGK